MDRHEDPAPTRSQPRLLDQVRGVIRRLHYSIRTEQTYVDWIRRFILFHGKRHPAEMGAPEVEAFLTHLAVQGKVAASTQNQALNAIVFLYRQVLKKELGWLEGVERAKKPARLPVVFTREEARAVLSRLDGIRWVMASLLYGSGLRLMECTRLRVKDVDFDQHQLIVRDGKGGKDRITMLPDRLVEPLKTHLCKVAVLHKKDLSEGWGWGRAPPLRPGEEVSEREPRMGMAVRIPGHTSLYRSALRDRAAPSHRPHGIAACGEGSGAFRWPREARKLPYFSARVCYPPLGQRIRHQDGAGASRPQGRVDHHDLHPRLEPRRPRGAEPAGRRGGLARLLHWCQPVCVRRVTTQTARLTRPVIYSTVTLFAPAPTTLSRAWGNRTFKRPFSSRDTVRLGWPEGRKRSTTSSAPSAVAP